MSHNDLSKNASGGGHSSFGRQIIFVTISIKNPQELQSYFGH